MEFAMASTKQEQTAIKEFETAQKKFWEGDIAKALASFEKIRGTSDLDSTFVERIDTFIAVCKERIDSAEEKLEDASDFFITGVYLLNNGEVDESISLLKEAVSKDKKNDAYLFTLACAHAHQENVDTALDLLTKAIELNPENKIFARNCHEFNALAKKSKKVAELIRDGGEAQGK
jgi:tetratricopeptide (TPR) repeat protein